MTDVGEGQDRDRQGEIVTEKEEGQEVLTEIEEEIGPLIEEDEEGKHFIYLM